jgi:hypothetical protein
MRLIGALSRRMIALQAMIAVIANKKREGGRADVQGNVAGDALLRRLGLHFTADDVGLLPAIPGGN